MINQPKYFISDDIKCPMFLIDYCHQVLEVPYKKDYVGQFWTSKSEIEYLSLERRNTDYGSRKSIVSHMGMDEDQLAIFKIFKNNRKIYF